MDYVQKKVVHSPSCAADREAHCSLAAVLIGDVLGLAHSWVANDDDDTADQSCRWGQRRHTQLDAPADALDQSQSVRGLNKSLATQHAEVPQTFDEHVGLDAIFYSKLIRQEGFMPMRCWLAANDAALGTQTTQVGWKEDRRV
jgi:hypothetical protein